MKDEINYQNNPLHGVSLKNLLIEIVDHYGFEILYVYLNVNCFKTKPSIDSSVKFLKKTDWAREKVEGFYLYNFNSLPRATAQQFELSPRDRIIPKEQVPGEPAKLSFEDAERLQKKREKRAAERGQGVGQRSVPAKHFSAQKSSEDPKKRENNIAQTIELDVKDSSNTVVSSGSDPWATWKNKSN
jgi:uncharacterized protein (DUF2132 family)